MKKITIFIPLILSLIVTIFTSNSSEFYSELTKPLFAPPGYLFGIIWPILYILMGLSYYLYRKDNPPLLLYYIQLFINLTWTIIFFNYKLICFSAIWLLVLVLINLFILVKYYFNNKISFYLYIPYILWILFALYLNVNICLLN